MSETFRKLTRTTVKVGVLGAGVLMIGSQAHAADLSAPNLQTGVNQGILNGTQVYLPIQAPINLCGVAVAVAGAANAGCAGGSSASIESTGITEGGWFGGGTVANLQSGLNQGLLNGTQVYAPIQIPINVCGVAVGVLGAANAACVGGSSATVESASTDAANVQTGLNQGLANGTQLYAPIQVPINVCGVAVAVLGAANAGCVGGSSATINGDDADDDAQWTGKSADDRGYGWDKKGHKKAKGESGRTELVGLDSLTGLAGGLGGGPTAAPKQQTKAAKGAKSDSRYGNHDNDGGDVCIVNGQFGVNQGALNGTQLAAPIQVPIDISGVAVGVLGAANAQSVGGSSATFC